ncbi:hypothetical protein DFH06DRAFT_1138080 [Mycena polygramma]|nr:hypothetical protein DFH06DRAFT_1138080 [Mycena polygramma]
MLFSLIASLAILVSSCSGAPISTDSVSAALPSTSPHNGNIGGSLSPDQACRECVRMFSGSFPSCAIAAKSNGTNPHDDVQCMSDSTSPLSDAVAVSASVHTAQYYSISVVFDRFLVPDSNSEHYNQDRHLKTGDHEDKLAVGNNVNF